MNLLLWKKNKFINVSKKKSSKPSSKSLKPTLEWNETLLDVDSLSLGLHNKNQKHDISAQWKWGAVSAIPSI